MFTGIIETTGKILSIRDKGRDREFTVSAEFVSELKIGDSVSINGACQSVIEKDDKSFSFFSSMETLSLTTLSGLKNGDRVNLERALSLQSRLDGHIVSGHVDGTAEIIRIQKGDGSYRYAFNVKDKSLMPYIAKKGSITVDGISLTIYDVSETGFECAVIPITLQDTTLKDKNSGDEVNIETDVLAKYIARLIGFQNAGKQDISLDFLREHGFA